MGGMEPYLVAMCTEPDLVLAINEVTSEFHLSQAQKATDLGADIIALADDYAFRQQSFIPREKFVTFCLPALQKMCDLAHRNGCRLLFHSDGNLAEYLDLFVEAGVDFLHPVEPGAMDIRKVHAQDGDRIVVCGNVDCANSLTFGEPADVEREVTQLLRDVAPGGRSIMSSSNTIHSKVRPDTCRAMLDTLRRCGSRFPEGGAAVDHLLPGDARDPVADRAGSVPPGDDEACGHAELIHARAQPCGVVLPDARAVLDLDRGDARVQ